MKTIRLSAATDFRRHRRAPRNLDALSERLLRDIGFLSDDLGRAGRIRA